MPSKNKAVQEAEKLLTRRVKPKPPQEVDLLSSGCTMLNLACSGRTTGAFAKGTYNFVIGDSDSGKTWLCHSVLAEASINKAFDNYRFIYDDVEVGSWFDIRQYFGKRLADRIEPSCWLGRMPWRSTTVEELFVNIDHAYKGKRPFIYIVDSQDALSSKIEEDDKAGMAGAKAKYIGAQIRMMLPKLSKTGSLVLIVGQAHANIGLTARYQPKRFSGGDALAYYAQTRIWTSGSKLKKKVGAFDRDVGTLCKAYVERSRLSGARNTVFFPIKWNLGIDDLEACVRYLVSEKHWKRDKGDDEDKDFRNTTFQAPEFKFRGRPDTLIKQIEKDGKERDLRILVGRVWRDIADACADERKPRYE